MIDPTEQTEDASKLHLLTGDMCDTASLIAAVEASQPDEVYSLAAQSHVKVSFEVPEATADVTGMGVLRLLQAVRDVKPDARFFHAGSSEQFGLVKETPQNEQTPFHPRSPYACAKVFACHITQNYREAYWMFASNGIFFNHESPRRGEDFVTRKITLAAKAIVAESSRCCRSAIWRQSETGALRATTSKRCGESCKRTSQTIL